MIAILLIAGTYSLISGIVISKWILNRDRGSNKPALRRNKTVHLPASQEQFLLSGPSIAHELKAPLSTILSVCNYLRDEGLSHEHAGLVTNIVDTTNHAITVVENILVYSKLSTGSLHTRLTNTRLDDILTSAVYMATSSVGKPVSSVLINSAIPCKHVNVSASYLKQILINLLTNALKHSPDDHSVVLTIESKPHSELSTEIFTFLVTDHGAGIPHIELENIFLPFYQTPDNVRSGTGLGLSIARELVTELGGTLSVRSRVGSGSTFFFSIPIRSQKLDENYMYY